MVHIFMDMFTYSSFSSMSQEELETVDYPQTIEFLFVSMSWSPTREGTPWQKEQVLKHVVAHTPSMYSAQSKQQGTLTG